MTTRRGRGEGSITRRADGRWMARVDLGWQDGKRRRNGRTKREVQDKLRETLHRTEKGLPPIPEQETVGAFLRRWLEIVRGKVRPRTHKSYEQVVRIHLEPGIGRVRLAKLTPLDVSAWFESRHAAGVGGRTIHYARAVLRAALNQALKWELVSRNVASLTDPPRYRAREIAPLTPEQTRKFLAAVAGHRLEALFTVAIGLGLRLGEALGLPWDAVNLDAGTLWVHQTLERAGKQPRFGGTEVRPRPPNHLHALPAPRMESVGSGSSRRNPGSGQYGTVSPGVGKTSLAQCTAHALGRGFVKLSCGGLHDETDLRGHNRTWRDAQPGSILREMRRVGSNDPVFVLDEIDKLGPAPAAVLLEVLDPKQNHSYRDAFIELPFDLSAVLFITRANEPTRVPPALRDRLEVIDLPGYTEAGKIAIAETHLIPAQNRAAGLTAAPVRVTRGACRRMIRDYTSERRTRQLTRCLQTACRKVALGLETGDAALVHNRITAAQVRTLLGAPARDPADGLARLREQVDAPGMPDAVRERRREVLERLAAWPRTDPEHAKRREYLRRLASLPWTRRTAAPLDLARARTLLDAGHAGHGAVKERLVDYIAVRLTKPEATAPLLCLMGPGGVGKSSLARLLAAALERARAWVACGELNGPAAVYGAPSGPPGRIVDDLRRVGVRNPVVVLDEADRLDEGSGTAAALLEAIVPAPGAAFRDRYDATV